MDKQQEMSRLAQQISQQKFWVVGAYMNADSGTQAPNAQSPGNTPNASLASSLSANKNIAQPAKAVNIEGGNENGQAAQDEAKGKKFSVYYVDIKKATGLLRGAKVLMPKMPATSSDGYINSITDPGSPVKPKFDSVTETQQFKRWFGVWQNHPNTASKIVNADGTPRVMYHGSPAQFTIFDKKKTKSSGQYGRGSGTRS